MREILETYEVSQPWVVYVYGRTHDRWWPPWNSTRVLGYCKIECQCCICGDRTVFKLSMPRFGKIERRNAHPQRTAYLARHQHPLQRTAPETWVWPLRNVAAHSDTLDILTDVAERAVRTAASRAPEEQE